MMMTWTLPKNPNLPSTPKDIDEKVVPFSKNGKEVSFSLRSPMREAIELVLFSLKCGIIV